MKTVQPLVRLLLVAAVYVAASWLVYGWTLDAPFLLDDQQTIRNNPAIQSLALPDAINPPPTPMGFSRRPIANLSMAVNFAAGDLQISGYRIFNLLLHAINAFLLFLLIRLVAENFVRLPPRAAEVAAFFAGLLWVVHPLSTSAVHYLTQRPEMLAACAFLAMFYAQSRALLSPHPRRWLIAACFACVLAMGSKESMALLPVLSVLFDRCVAGWTWREQWRRRGFYYAALAITLVWPLLLLVKDDSGLALNMSFAERWRYFLTVAEGLVRHVSLVLWPRGLVFDYGTRLVSDLGDVAPHMFAVVIAAMFVLWGLWRRSLAAWAGAAVFVVMLPSWINMAPGQPVAEHRFYLPAGLILACLSVVSAARCVHSPRWRLPVVSAAALVSVLFIWLAVHRAALYADPAALISQDVQSWPRSDRSYMNLGLVLEVGEDYEGAARQFELAIGERETANWRPMVALARLKMRAGDVDGAVAMAADAFRHVFSVPGSPDLAQLINAVVSSFRTAGRLDAALPLLRAAQKTAVDSRLPADRNRLIGENIRLIAAETGGLESVAEEFRRNAETDPLTRLNFAIALAREGKTGEAIALLDRMIAEAPPGSDPLKIADVHALKGAMSADDPFAVRASFEEAVRLNPSHSEALNNFAWLLATSTDEAIYDPPRALELARKAVRLRSDETNFQGTLAVASAAAGFDKEAEAALSEAQRLGRINGNTNPALLDLVREARSRAAKNR